MNTVRVYLHDLAWGADAKGFKERIREFLGIVPIPMDDFRSGMPKEKANRVIGLLTSIERAKGRNQGRPSMLSRVSRANSSGLLQRCNGRPACLGMVDAAEWHEDVEPDHE